MSLHVTHTVGGLHTALGGPSRSVPGLCEALVKRNTSVTLLSVDLVGEGESVAPSSRVKSRVVPGRRLRRLRQIWSARFAGALADEIEDSRSAVVHDHGLWLSTNYLTARVARRHEVPLVVAPRGMLSAWALQQNRHVKSMAWRVYQSRELRSAAAIHATSCSEAHDIRKMGMTQPIAIIPNGVHVEDFVPTWPAATRGVGRTALFLSRLHKKKGLENLIQAWAAVRPEGWNLLVCGPGDPQYRRSISALVETLGIGSNVAVRQEASEREKRDLMTQASLFVLPTFSENFGIVVAEALAAGVPVITTKGAPWRELEIHGCGWWIDIGVQPLVESLHVATLMSRAQLQEWGRRGQRLVAKRYTWDKAAAKMTEVYAWLNGSGSHPSCFDHEFNQDCVPESFGRLPC